MGPGDVFGLIVSMAGLLGIVAIFTGHLRRRMEHKERIAELKATGGQDTTLLAQRDETIQKLEQRLRVLERIATDKPTTLAAQIDGLREPAD